MVTAPSAPPLTVSVSVRTAVPPAADWRGGRTSCIESLLSAARPRASRIRRAQPLPTRKDRAGDAQQRLEALAAVDSLCQGRDRLRLVAGRLELGDDLERPVATLAVVRGGHLAAERGVAGRHFFHDIAIADWRGFVMDLHPF